MMITIAPLRERGHDAVLLANYFMQLTEKRYGLEKHSLSQTAIDALLNYIWPGNVRELRHQISRAVLLSNNTQLTVTDLALPTSNSELQILNQLNSQSPQNSQNQQNPQSLPTLEASEKHMLMTALEATHYNVSEAARKLGITRMTMRYRMDKHGIKH
jgi:transcriptional regulator with GAF, ATPase, and Fis domain